MLLGAVGILLMPTSSMYSQSTAASMTGSQAITIPVRRLFIMTVHHHTLSYTLTFILICCDEYVK
jgi:hypothetical protein